MCNQDCFNCGHSMVTDQDELYCAIKSEIVQDDGHCDEYNQ